MCDSATLETRAQSDGYLAEETHGDSTAGNIKAGHDHKSTAQHSAAQHSTCDSNKSEVIALTSYMQRPVMRFALVTQLHVVLISSQHTATQHRQQSIAQQITDSAAQHRTGICTK